MVQELSPVIAAQVDYCHGQIALLGRMARRLPDDRSMPAELPMAYGDWVADEEIGYFAVFTVQQYEMHRLERLRKGKGPYFCRGCEEPQPGWTALSCWECAWPKKLRARAIECGRRWHETHEGYIYPGPPLYADLVKTRTAVAS